MGAGVLLIFNGESCFGVKFEVAGASLCCACWATAHFPARCISMKNGRNFDTAPQECLKVFHFVCE